jgi:hypothetical protein
MYIHHSGMSHLKRNNRCLFSETKDIHTSCGHNAKFSAYDIKDSTKQAQNKGLLCIKWCLIIRTSM